jgi:hypothetical protein
VPRFSLHSETGEISFWGWMFYDSSHQNTRNYPRKKVDEYIRLYVTDLNWVVLECVRENPKAYQISFHATLEEAFDVLAAKPLHVVSPKLYSDFMRDVSELAEV